MRTQARVRTEGRRKPQVPLKIWIVRKELSVLFTYFRLCSKKTEKS